MLLMQPELFNFQSYLLVIAHPDDEVNCGILLHRLIAQDKQITVVLLTNGDAGSNPAGRVDEMRESALAVGLNPDNLVFLGIPEIELLSNMTMAFERTLEAAMGIKPECVLSLD